MSMIWLMINNNYQMININKENNYREHVIICEKYEKYGFKKKRLNLKHSNTSNREIQPEYII